MKRLLLLAAGLALFAPGALAQRGRIQIFPPAQAQPATYVYITVRTFFIKETKLYVDGQYHGRRDMRETRSGLLEDTLWYVRFPQITTQDGQWTITVTGTDIDGKPVTATVKVSPTIYRDAQLLLEPKAPALFRAPDEKAFERKELDAPSSDPKFKVEISPTGGTILPGTVIQFTTKAFDEEGKQIPEFQPPIAVTGGFVKKINKWHAGAAPGEYRISVRFKDALAQVFYRVARPLPITVRSWGVHQLRISGALFAASTLRVDPNVRPTTKINALILPEDKHKTLVIKVEGLDNGGAVKITKELVVEVLAPK